MLAASAARRMSTFSARRMLNGGGVEVCKTRAVGQFQSLVRSEEARDGAQSRDRPATDGLLGGPPTAQTRSPPAGRSVLQHRCEGLAKVVDRLLGEAGEAAAATSRARHSKLLDRAERTATWALATARQLRELDEDERRHGHGAALGGRGGLFGAGGALGAAGGASSQQTATRPPAGASSQQTVAAQHQLARVLAAQGRLDAALPVGREAMAGARGLLGRYHPLSTQLTGYVGKLQLARGELAEAEELLLDAAAACADLYGEQDEQTLRLSLSSAEALLAQGKALEAEPTLRRCLHVSRAAHGAEGSQTIAALSNLGAMLLERGERLAGCERGREAVAEAEGLLAELLRACERVHGRQSAYTHSASLLLKHCRVTRSRLGC